MTVGAGVTVQDGSLVALGATILTEVGDNVLVTTAAGAGMTSGAFVGVRSAPAGSRSVFPVGKLRGLRFMCTFRFKMWWMTQRMGTSGSEIPFETQFLIVEGGAGARDGRSAVYTVFLPILEGSFRSVLQGNADDELEICLESGDLAVASFEGTHLVFVGAGSDPFEVITNSVKAVERHLQTFTHRENKKIPDMLNWFGWCTWDAFYTDVTAEGVKEGLRSLEKGGTAPKFVIIDDGWQSVSMDPAGIASLSDNSAKKYHQSLEASIARNFRDNGIICCMSHNTDNLYSMLKIWNLNEHTGVIGAFNCQGAGWCRVGKKNLVHDEQPGTVTGAIRAQDVDHLANVAADDWNGDVIVYSHIAGEVTCLPKNVALPVTLKSREYEVFTIAPLKQLANGVSFAPVGLIRMFNSGGAVTGLRCVEDAGVELKVRGAGTVGAYSSARPKKVAVDSEAAEFSYDDGCGMVTVELAVPEKELYSWTVWIEY
ncbi:hypothetical protein ABZP36_026311 [Zizania latifolia]